jgi:broad specificity phosphatase PhoE
MKYKLTEKGQKQAEDLKNLLKNENVDLIFSSYFERAIDTIKPFSIES